MTFATIPNDLPSMLYDQNSSEIYNFFIYDIGANLSKYINFYFQIMIDKKIKF